MKKLLLSLLIVNLFFLSCLYPNSFIVKLTRADNCDDLCKQLQDKQAEIKTLEDQLTQTKDQEKTLQSQLNLIDGQSKVTSLKIDETNLQIEKLKREITDLSSRIDRIG